MTYELTDSTTVTTTFLILFFPVRFNLIRSADTFFLVLSNQKKKKKQFNLGSVDASRSLNVKYISSFFLPDPSLVPYIFVQYIGDRELKFNLG